MSERMEPWPGQQNRKYTCPECGQAVHVLSQPTERDVISHMLFHASCARSARQRRIAEEKP